MMHSLNKMANSILGKVQKPDKWPESERECTLQNILGAMQRFIEEPNYKNKEVILSLATGYDLSQKPRLGIWRISEYEVELMNVLYLCASGLNTYSVKLFLYDLIQDNAYLQREFSCALNRQSDYIETYSMLMPPLDMFYLIWYEYIHMEPRSFADQIVSSINELIHQDEDINQITGSLISIINDLSYFNCKKTNRVLAFSKDELVKIFTLEAKLLKKNGQKINVRPVKGLVKMAVSNYILKSRYGYNDDYICKYVPKETVCSSLENYEIWLKNIAKLNDKREEKVLPQLFVNKKWLNVDWVKCIDFTPTRTYFASSFSKKLNNKDMKNEYGSCIYGYKNDKIAETISPIIIKEKNGERMPVLSQVLSFDVLYDVNLAKEELKFLCKVIDLFDLEEEEKCKFLEELLQYWILSVKDKKWGYEKERRYVLFMYEDYEYLEMKIEDDFLKLKSSLLLLPDFLLGRNPYKTHLKMYIDEKREVAVMKDYMFCEDCFSIDYDSVHNKVQSCPICGSKRFHMVKYEGKNRR